MGAVSSALLLGAVLSIVQPTDLSLHREFAPPPRDPRFFGSYCQTAPIAFCVKIERRFWWDRTVCVDVEDTRLDIEYADVSKGAMLSGRGGTRVDGHDLSIGYSGVVRARGLAESSASVAGIGQSFGKSWLSGDGLELALLARGRVLRLRKDACGNVPPQVTVSSQDGASLDWGESHCFRGKVTSDEDPSFPRERMVLASNRDGPLQGFAVPPLVLDPNNAGGAKELTRCTSSLSPGAHEITFTATDSGGLSASASVDVTVSNDPPLPPVIIQPRVDDLVVATGALVFEGKARDPEEGMLDGDSLVWSYARVRDQWQLLGHGRRLVAAFAEPGGLRLRLSARDAGGAVTSVEQSMTVLPFEGNTPPRVTIDVPKHWEQPGSFGGFFPPGDVTFRGTVDDSEDPDGALALRWDAVPLQPPGPSLDPVLDSTLATFRLGSPDGNRAVYRILFTARDRGGLVGKKVIEIVIVP